MTEPPGWASPVAPQDPPPSWQPQGPPSPGPQPSGPQSSGPQAAGPDLTKGPPPGWHPPATGGGPAASGWQAPHPAPQAPRPGVVPLRPLGVGEILDGAVSYIRAQPRTTLGLSAVVAVVTQVLTLVLQVSLIGTATTVDPTEVGGLLAGTGLLGIATSIIGLVAVSVLTGVLIVVLGEAVLGRSIPFAAVRDRVRPRLAGLVGVSLLAGLAVFGVLLVGLLPGILLAFAGSDGAAVAFIVLGGLAAVAAAVYLGVSWSLAAPAYVLEGLGVVESLGRSRRLVAGQWWRVFGILLLGAILAAIVGGILGFPFGLAGGVIAAGDPTAVLPLVLTAIGAIIASTLTTPFSAGISGLVYLDQRMRREAFDVVLARAAGPA